MRTCQYNTDMVCRVCGHRTHIAGLIRECDGVQVVRPGLGDMVAAGLSVVGITKERVSAIVGGDCGCAERQDWLNQLGHKLGIGTPPPPESLHPPAQ